MFIELFGSVSDSVTQSHVYFRNESMFIELIGSVSDSVTLSHVYFLN